MSAYRFIEVDDPEPGIRRIALNRPDKRNALSNALRGELFDALRKADADPSIGAIIIKGNGKCFSAGYDLAQSPNEPLPRTVSPGEGVWPRHLVDGWFEMWDMATPIIAQVHDPAEIENTITKLGGETGSGLILVPDNFTTVHRELIISLTARFRIPAIYPYRYFAEAGGLLSYGVDAVDLFRRASEYVSRILRGANPTDLPVQAPTKFELVINLGTAKALGLVIPRVLLVGADQMIE